MIDSIRFRKNKKAIYAPLNQNWGDLNYIDEYDFYDEYDKIEALGKGSFGCVYKAQKRGQFYAIKEIPQHLTKKFSNIRKIFENIKLLAEKNSQFFVQYFDLYNNQLDKGEKFYLVQEFQSQNLRQFLMQNKLKDNFPPEGSLSHLADCEDNIKQNGGSSMKLRPENLLNFDEQRIQNIFSKIVQAYSILVENNIIYRNIKPQNIFIGDDYQVKLGDFSLLESYCSQSHDSYLQLLIKNGSLQYQPPENIDISHNCHSKHYDIWSLGVVLFQLVFSCQIFPFSGSFPDTLIQDMKCKLYDFQKRQVKKFDVKQFLEQEKNGDYLPALKKMYFHISEDFRSDFEDLLARIFVYDFQNNIFDNRISLQELKVHPFLKLNGSGFEMRVQNSLIKAMTQNSLQRIAQNQAQNEQAQFLKSKKIKIQQYPKVNNASQVKVPSISSNASQVQIQLQSSIKGKQLQSFLQGKRKVSLKKYLLIENKQEEHVQNEGQQSSVIKKQLQQINSNEEQQGQQFTNIQLQDKSIKKKKQLERDQLPITLTHMDHLNCIEEELQLQYKSQTTPQLENSQSLQKNIDFIKQMQEIELTKREHNCREQANQYLDELESEVLVQFNNKQKQIKQQMPHFQKIQDNVDCKYKANVVLISSDNKFDQKTGNQLLGQSILQQNITELSENQSYMVTSQFQSEILEDSCVQIPQIPQWQNDSQNRSYKNKLNGKHYEEDKNKSSKPLSRLSDKENIKIQTQEQVTQKLQSNKNYFQQKSGNKHKQQNQQLQQQQQSYLITSSYLAEIPQERGEDSGSPYYSQNNSMRTFQQQNIDHVQEMQNIIKLDQKIEQEDQQFVNLESKFIEECEEEFNQKEEYVSILQFDTSQLMSQRIEGLYYQDIRAFEFLGEAKRFLDSQKLLLEKSLGPQLAAALKFSISKMRLFYSDRLLYNIEVKYNVPKYEISEEDFNEWITTQSFQQLSKKVSNNKNIAEKLLQHDLIKKEEIAQSIQLMKDMFPKYKGINWHKFFSNDIGYIKNSQQAEEPYRLIVSQCFKHFLKLQVKSVEASRILQAETYYKIAVILLISNVAKKNIPKRLYVQNTTNYNATAKKLLGIFDKNNV